jgi:hypothetical protein
LPPAAFGAARPLGRFRQHFVGQREFAAAAFRHNFHGDAIEDRGILRHPESEDQPRRAIDFQILARVLDVLAVAPIGKGETPADSRVDFRSDHLAGGGGKEPFRRAHGIEPGIEDAFGWEREAAGDADDRIGFCVHK